ncbi:hypothetical protein NDU88_000580 [Pleurodeles waltl]|uniref:Uncharacterized protein n=1 Tax=Pleurodeles waltl TaxID=8319 RepID=A0AAV7SA13_PLEWA|nr:hypothetical protein NDU88_000580 [Pleurodeles waltl]
MWRKECVQAELIQREEELTCIQQLHSDDEEWTREEILAQRLVISVLEMLGKHTLKSYRLLLCMQVDRSPQYRDISTKDGIVKVFKDHLEQVYSSIQPPNMEHLAGYLAALPLPCLGDDAAQELGSDYTC